MNLIELAFDYHDLKDEMTPGVKRFIDDLIKEYSQEIERLNNNRNKAIKYIEDNTYKSNETEYMDLTGIRELLDILKEVDKPRKGEVVSLEELESYEPKNSIEEEYYDELWR